MKLIICLLTCILLSFGCKSQTDYKKYEVRNLQIKLDDDIKFYLDYLSTNMNPLVEVEMPDYGHTTYIIHSYFYYDITQKEKNLILKKISYFKKRINLSDSDRRVINYYIIPLNKLSKDSTINDLVPDNSGVVPILNHKKRWILRIKSIRNQEFEHIQIFYQSEDGNKFEKMFKDTISGISLNFHDNPDECINFLIAFRALCLIE